MQPYLNVISKQSAFIFWLFEVHSTRIIRYLEPSWRRPGTSVKYICPKLSLTTRTAIEHRLWSDHVMAKTEGIFFFYCRWFSHPVFLYASPLYYSLLDVLIPKPCSFLTLTTKLSGWALRMKPALSQPCSFIVTATENIIFPDCSSYYLTSSSNYLFQLLWRYCLYFSKGFWPIFLGAERWEIDTFGEKYVLVEWDRKKLGYKGSTSWELDT